jgi:YesN/AraC family two-component response regulator
MPEMTGIELTRHLGDKKPIIVFTTSKKEYAVDAFELNVADYIVKPVTPHRFLQAVEKVREIYDSNKVEVSVEEKEFVFIRDNGVLKRLLIEDIHFLEAMGDYVKLYTQQKFHAVHTTLKNVEDKLPSNKFLRVHRSYTANTYAAGQVLFDVNDPTKVIARLDKPFFVPTEPFEKSGQYPAGTVFVEGMVYYQNKWFLYYGCADSRVGVAIYDPSKYK